MVHKICNQMVTFRSHNDWSYGIFGETSEIHTTTMYCEECRVEVNYNNVNFDKEAK
jgi:hypothetical protein